MIIACELVDCRANKSISLYWHLDFMKVVDIHGNEVLIYIALILGVTIFDAIRNSFLRLQDYKLLIGI